MLFNSYDFIFAFLPLILWAHAWALRRRGPRAAGTVLAIASLVSYGWWYAPYLLVLLASIVINFWLGVRLGDETRPDAERHRVLQLGLALNLGTLGFFKYLGWGVETVEGLLGVAIPFPEIALPIGISFYTFQQVAYLVDARRGKCREHDFVDYVLFVTFFPQLIAGPIVHHGEMLPQFREGRAPSDTDRAVGLTFFGVGLAKKVLIADFMAPYVDTAFGRAAAGQDVSSAMAWQGIFAYQFQLYFDFSGYSDMAIGLGRLFGIKLPANFDAPYRCTSMSEFWRRWHLTLSRFLREYLYIPLGGNRLGDERRRLNMFLTLFLAGVWHGAGWTFVLWAIQMSGYVYLHDHWRHRTGGLPENAIGTAIGRTVSWLCMMFSWPLFRCETVDGAVVLLKGMVFTGDAGIGKLQGPIVVAFVGLTIWTQVAPTTQQWLRNYEPVHGFKPIDGLTLSDRWSWAPTRGWAAALALLFILCIPVLDRADAFLYWAF
jgi:alginate O-acetyltransferase complex protein AlgI